MKIAELIGSIVSRWIKRDDSSNKKIIYLESELKSNTDLIHEFRATLTSIRDCPHSNVKQYHIDQINNLLTRKFKRT